MADDDKVTWPIDPEEIARHDREAHQQRHGQKYNTPPPGRNGK